VFALLLSLLSPAHAETAEEIVAKARAANSVSSAIQHVKLTVVDKNGNQRIKELDLKTRKVGEESQTYMRVTAPSTEAGTAFLMIDKPGPADEQTMYMPATKQSMMIAGSQKKGSFVGSDFSFEDFGFRDASSGGMTLVEEAADHWVLETAPTSSAYSKVRVTITRSNLVISKVEFFDANGLLKVLEVKQTAVEGGVTIPTLTEMRNVVRGTHTVLEITSHQLNVGPDVLPDETFTRSFLQRG
jgi:hypothetical protein